MIYSNILIAQIEEINGIERTVEPPLDGPLCDLLWADPIDDIYANSTEFKENAERECSYYFGNAPVKELLRDKGLVSVIRAH
jgi:serine/threonine-protein phosphatase 2B catalytic subunit